MSINEPGYEDSSYRDSTCTGAWRVILEEIEKLRREHDMVKLLPTFVHGEDLFGFGDQKIVKVSLIVTLIMLKTSVRSQNTDYYSSSKNCASTVVRQN